MGRGKGGGVGLIDDTNLFASAETETLTTDKRVYVFVYIYSELWLVYFVYCSVFHIY